MPAPQAAADALALARWIAARRKPPTLKEVAQGAPTRRLRQREHREAAIDLLRDKGWLRLEQIGGRAVLLLHPRAVCAEAA